MKQRSNEGVTGNLYLRLVFETIIVYLEDPSFIWLTFYHHSLKTFAAQGNSLLFTMLKVVNAVVAVLIIYQSFFRLTVIQLKAVQIPFLTKNKFIDLEKLAKFTANH